MTEENRDRRIQRTRLALREALVGLLAERSWDDINIRDLCARANVGRSTFYLHFQNKEELLVGGFDDLRDWLSSQSSGRSEANPPLFVRGLIEHVQEQRTLFRAVIGRRSGHVVQKRFREMVTKLVKDSDAFPYSGWQGEASAHYIAGALVEMLAWWVDTGAERSANEIEEFFYSLTLPLLQQACVKS